MTKLKLFRGQFGIAGLLLGLTVVATWTAFAVSHSKVQQLKNQIRMLQQSVGELLIDDPKKIHAIAKAAVRYSDDIWQVYLPESRTYQICLVTRGITTTNFPEPAKRTELKPGRHRIELHRNNLADGDVGLLVVIDGQTVIEAIEASGWEATKSSSSAGVFRTPIVAAVDRPLVLKRLQIHEILENNSTRSPPDDEGGNGILLWIE